MYREREWVDNEARLPWWGFFRSSISACFVAFFCSNHIPSFLFLIFVCYTLRCRSAALQRRLETVWDDSSTIGVVNFPRFVIGVFYFVICTLSLSWSGLSCFRDKVRSPRDSFARSCIQVGIDRGPFKKCWLMSCWDHIRDSLASLSSLGFDY